MCPHSHHAHKSFPTVGAAILTMRNLCPRVEERGNKCPFLKKGRKPDHELHRRFTWTAGARYWKINARVRDQFHVRIHSFCFMHRRFTSTSPKLDYVAVRSYEWHVRQPWPCRTHQYNKEHLMPAIMRPLTSLLMPARQLSCLGIHPFMLPWFESKETRNIRCSKCKSGVPFCIGL